MARVITVTSGKGGVGKTTTTANLGTALARYGARVALIDADIGLRNLDVVMGLENRIVYDLVDVIEGRARVRQALIKDKRLPEMYLMPAAQTRDKDAVNAEDMIALANEMHTDFDYILIDSPAGIESGFRNAIACANEVLIVTTPEVPSVRDADRVVGLVEASEKGPPRLIINRIKPRLVSRGEMLSVDEVVEILAIEPIGVVPEDEVILSSTNRGEAAVFNAQSIAGRAFDDIARRLRGEEVPFMDMSEQPGVLERWFGGLFRRRAKA
ncbi:MAG: septum site-determining protein MinD [Chloroflexaceae bacterium]|nr:septum site-determining protein MinD [Chloroflexaceae bacterium]